MVYPLIQFFSFYFLFFLDKKIVIKSSDALYFNFCGRNDFLKKLLFKYFFRLF